MSRENPFSMHRRSFWEAHAGNPRIPVWQRVYALAYGVHRRNGHAPFKLGEVAQAVALTDVDPETGEVLTFHKPSSADVSHAIAAAVANGFLDPSRRRPAWLSHATRSRGDCSAERTRSVVTDTERLGKSPNEPPDLREIHPIRLGISPNRQRADLQRRDAL